MKKRIADDVVTKAKKREIKKRPRMQMHGAKLRASATFGGNKLAKR